MKWILFAIITLLLIPLFVVVNAIAPLCVVAMVLKKRYALNVLVAYDQLGNAVFGGDPQETISSRIGKSSKKGNRFARVCSWYLSIPDPGHTEDAINTKEGKDGLF